MPLRETLIQLARFRSSGDTALSKSAFIASMLLLRPPPSLLAADQACRLVRRLVNRAFVSATGLDGVGAGCVTTEPASVAELLPPPPPPQAVKVDVSAQARASLVKFIAIVKY